VVNVQTNSPGSRAGLQDDDIIQQMGNRRIQSHLDIDGFFLDYFVDDNVQMVISRKGKIHNVQLKLSEYTGVDK
jgi:S1-C subfamily serine protease